MNSVILPLVQIQNLLTTPLLETTGFVWLLLMFHCVGSLAFPDVGCTIAYSGRVFQTSKLKESLTSRWACILVDMLLVSALVQDGLPTPASGQRA